MRHILIILIGAGLLGLTGCGPINSQAIFKDQIAQLTESQPISAGDVIYHTNIKFEYAVPTEDMGFSAMGARYRGEVELSETYYYLGIENNNLKIRKTVSGSQTEWVLGGNSSAKDEILILPVNESRQALLKVTALKKGVEGTFDGDKLPDNVVIRAPEQLLITVIDDFGRIKVEKYSKN